MHAKGSGMRRTRRGLRYVGSGKTSVVVAKCALLLSTVPSACVVHAVADALGTGTLDVLFVRPPGGPGIDKNIFK